MLAVQQFDPEHSNEDEHNDGDEKSKICSQTPIVVGLLRRLEKMRADNVACAGTNKQDTGGNFSLGVPSRVLP